MVTPLSAIRFISLSSCKRSVTPATLQHTAPVTMYTFTTIILLSSTCSLTTAAWFQTYQVMRIMIP